MHFRRHSELKGLHARLSPSKYHWLNYDESRMFDYLVSMEAAARGTRLHHLAKQLIDEKIKMPRNDVTINKYVNDCIGWDLQTEVALYYSDDCFGHVDAIGYDPKRKILRISDLKTGVSPTSIKQLEIYAALFFFEYGRELEVGPFDVQTELRIYQNDERREEICDPGVIVHRMDTIRTQDKLIKRWREEMM